MTKLPHVSPEQAKQMLDAGALLVDVREPDEHAREHIPLAKSMPLSSLSASPFELEGANAVIFHCRSGNRTTLHADKLITGAPCEVFLLDGGLEAWKKAGLPVRVDAHKPLELMRQVQIAAGSLVLLGVLLGALVHPALYGVAAAVGAGLTFAGVSGFCGLARLLAAMPWNARARSSQ